MYTNILPHTISKDKTAREALVQLNELGSNAILFVIDENYTLIGSLTDGDIRRGLINEIDIQSNVTSFIQPNPKFIVKNDYSVLDIIELRKNHFKILPVVDDEKKIVNIINFNHLKSYLPIDTVIMAGGRGERLKPLTNETPKPLLKIGNKPILEHHIDNLAKYGIDDFWISINYLGEQIVDYFKQGQQKNISINYITEDKPLGTMGSVSYLQDNHHQYILITNSDLLTNIDYEDFFINFVENNADFSVISIPYKVEIPYAILELNDNILKDFKEKPTYIYQSNGGVYLMKKELLDYIPTDKFFNATDMMELLIQEKKKVINYSHNGYWLDIGKHEDFNQAQKDILHLSF
jgi:dTDP-glucose pyrophosphorylase